MAEERTFSLLSNQQVIINGSQGNGIGGTALHQFENNMLFKTMERLIAKKKVEETFFWQTNFYFFISNPLSNCSRQWEVAQGIRLQKQFHMYLAKSEVQPQNSHEC